MFTTTRAQSTIDAHRGPFQLVLTRPHPRKADFYTTEWLPGTSDKTDVLEEAMALIRDPRDNISCVGIVSVTEQAYAFVVRKHDLEAV